MKKKVSEIHTKENVASDAESLKRRGVEARARLKKQKEEVLAEQRTLQKNRSNILEDNIYEEYSKPWNRTVETLNKIEDELKEAENNIRGFKTVETTQASPDGPKTVLKLVNVRPEGIEDFDYESNTWLRNVGDYDEFSIAVGDEPLFADPDYVTEEQEKVWDDRVEKAGGGSYTSKSFTKSKPSIDDISDAEKAKDAAETGGATNLYNKEEYEAWKAEQYQEKQASGAERAFGALGGIDKVLEITGTMAALAEAETPLPQQKKSDEWNAYMDMMKLRTEYGLSNESKTLMQRQAERTYHTHARLVGRYGTSSQAVLGAMGQNAKAKYDMDMMMGVKDQDQMFSNLRDDYQYYKEFEDPNSVNYKMKQEKLKNIALTNEATNMAMYMMTKGTTGAENQETVGKKLEEGKEATKKE
jgi:hypothetical protein